MKRLHLYILSSFLGPFVLTFFIVMFILLMQFLWKYIDELVGKGLEWDVIAELLLYASAGLVPLALPLAIMLASLMAFGNLGEHYELTALKAAGISLMRMMLPLTVLIVLLSIGAFYFSNHVLPLANLKTGSLLFDVSRKRPELSIKPGIFNKDVEGYSIRVLSKNEQTGMMFGFTLYDHSTSLGNRVRMDADSAVMDFSEDGRFMFLTLYDGYRDEELGENQRGPARRFPHRRDYFREQRIVLALTGFDFNKTDESLFRRNYQMLNLGQLQYAIDSLAEQIADREDRFVVGLLRLRYFKSEVKPVGLDSSRTDSLSPPALVAHSPPTPTGRGIDLDSLYRTFSDVRKEKVMNMALNYARTTMEEIERMVVEMDGRQKSRSRHAIEWHRKFTLSFACFIFFFIGAPLGAIIRKGGLGVPVVVSVLFFVLYYVISLTGDKFGREDILSPFWGMWASSFLLFPVGAFLTYKAATDSNLMSLEAYGDFFKRLFKRWRRAEPEEPRGPDLASLFGEEAPRA